MESKDFAGWVSNQALFQRNLIALVVKGFGPSVPDHETLTQTAKTLIEMHALSINGLENGLIYDRVADRCEPKPSKPIFRYGEKYGYPVTELHRHWMEDLLWKKPDSVLVEDTKLSVMFIEPDPTHTLVVDAWLCEEFHPVMFGGIPGVRDLVRENYAAVITVEYDAKTRRGSEINQTAAELLKGLNVQSANPHGRSRLADALAVSLNYKNESICDPGNIR